MRYAVISGGLTITELQLEVKRRGGRNLRVASASKQVFCDLEQSAVDRLKAIGCSVSKIGGIKADVMFPPIVTPPTPIAGVPTYSPAELSWATGLEDIRSIFEPPLYGKGINIAIIGTGIRETHTKINGRVVYSKNYTTDEMRDGFDHDTGVCDIILTITPECSILNLKVLGDKGEGTEEEVAVAIDDCITLHDTRPDIAPTVINLSLGGPDEANPANPLRVACRAAIDRGILVFASAGNGGPLPYSITCPACERYVFAIGSASYEPFTVSNFSSRGPTIEGLIKPDVVLFGENISLASSKSDTSIAAKSGTSFATPFGSSMGVLYQEGVHRQALWKEAVLGIPAGEIYYVPADELLDKYFPLFCLKPEGVAPAKDYDYGYGLPYGPLAFGLVTERPLVDVEILTSSIGPILILGLLGAVIAPMIKGLR